MTQQPATSSTRPADQTQTLPATRRTPFLLSWPVLVIVWSVSGGLVGMLPRLDLETTALQPLYSPWLAILVVLGTAALWYASELRHNYSLLTLLPVAALSALLAAGITTFAPSNAAYTMTVVGLGLGVLLGLVFGYAGLQGGLAFSLGSALGLFAIVGAFDMPVILILGLFDLFSGQDLALLGLAGGVPMGLLVAAFVGATLGAIRQITAPMEQKPQDIPAKKAPPAT